jgi:hypothetical protein
MLYHLYCKHFTQFEWLSLSIRFFFFLLALLIKQTTNKKHVQQLLTWQESIKVHDNDSKMYIKKLIVFSYSN